MDGLDDMDALWLLRCKYWSVGLRIGSRVADRGDGGAGEWLLMLDEEVASEAAELPWYLLVRSLGFSFFEPKSKTIFPEDVLLRWCLGEGVGLRPALVGVTSMTVAPLTGVGGKLSVAGEGREDDSSA